MRKEIFRELYLAVNELPDSYRKVFELYLLGRNDEEIAVLLFLPLFEVKGYRREAVYFLKGRLGDLFFWLQLMRGVNVKR